MELDRLRRELADEAERCGICRQWHGKILTAPSREALLELLVTGSDFAMEHSFPSGRLRVEFRDIAPHFGVYLGGRHTASGRRDVMALGDSEVTATYGGCSAGDVMAADRARLTVEADGNAYVALTLYGGARAKVMAAGSAKVVVIRHGGELETEAARTARVKVIDKRKE